MPEVVVWSRGLDRSWIRHLVEGIDGVVDMPAIAVTLPLAEIYDGVEFPARPHLVRMDEPREKTEPPGGNHPPPELA